jgi:hypothetical protein
LFLTVVLDQLALATWRVAPQCPQGIDHCFSPESPVTQLLMALVARFEVLTLLAIAVAIIGGHASLLRMRHRPATRTWRRAAWWALLLGYSTPLLIVAYFVWALFANGGGE